jgi:hypothetical protein
MRSRWKLLAVVGGLVLILVAAWLIFLQSGLGREVARVEVGEAPTTMTFSPESSGEIQLFSEVDMALDRRLGKYENLGEALPRGLDFLVRIEHAGDEQVLQCDVLRVGYTEWENRESGFSHEQRLRFLGHMKRCQFDAHAGEPVTVHVERRWTTPSLRPSIRKTELVAKLPGRFSR